MTDWKNCIITYADFPGIRKLAATGKASAMMRSIHHFVASNAHTLLRSHLAVYIWNDSILLVAEFANRKDKKRILEEQSAFKAAIDARVTPTHRPYVIVVQGKRFPIPQNKTEKRSELHPDVVALKSSSWAMANCFRIEEMSGNKAQWYIDSRITTGVKLENKQRCKKLPLLPRNEQRSIILINDDQLSFG